MNRWLVGFVALAFLVGGCTTEITNLIPPTEPPIVNIVPVDCNTNPGHVDCQTEEPEEEPLDISGSWQGILTDQGGAIVAAVVTLSLNQSGATFTGTWASATGLVGTLQGAVDDDGRMSGAFSITDGGGTCSGRLDGQATENRLDVLVGSIAGSCTGGYSVLDVSAAR